MKDMFYVLYRNSNDVLILPTAEERDQFVEHEQLVHDDCTVATYEEVKHLISGKTATFDHGFGCMAILAS